MKDQKKGKPRELRPEQSAAAYTLDKHVSVTAGPGSGKTTVLVQRYLQILKSRKAQVDQIVAITFTNRASNEMRLRLRGEIDRLLSESDQTERSRWLRHKRTLDGAVITTIHGFCSRLLREFPLEAGVDPQFTLLDEHQSAMLEEAVASEVVSELLDNQDELFTRLTLSIGRPRLGEAVLQVYRSIKNLGLELDEVTKATEQGHSTDADYAKTLSDLEQLIDEFLNLPELTPAAEEARREAASRWPEFRSRIQSPPTLDDAVDFCSLIDEFRRTSKPRASGKIKDLVRAIEELIWAKDAAGLLPRIAFDRFAGMYSASLLDAIAKIDARLVDEKQKLAALGYDDLQTRVLKLLQTRPDVVSRIASRYKFYLVDEVQDTNGIQQSLLDLLTLRSGRSANLFIVGDPKQSIYGFRGADVSVFSAITNRMVELGGVVNPLFLNFRSQEPLVKCFNELFRKIFAAEDVDPSDHSPLGYVPYEEGEGARDKVDDHPLVEFMVTVRPSMKKVGGEDEISLREADAIRVAERILGLVDSGVKTSPEECDDAKPSVQRFHYRDIAMLFRAMTQVGIYESALRQAGIPYRTVAGKGFYQREEIVDLIQLLRFVDNTTDELALAAVLRSPLCAVSDNALLALRWAPSKGEASDKGSSAKGGVRPLYHALLHHWEISNIVEEDRESLESAGAFLKDLLRSRHSLSISELLYRAIDKAEYLGIIGSSPDGGLRVANVQKLLVLAERFSRSGAVTVRDFVRYVDDFESRGGREGEGLLEDNADAVTLMSVHQSKGQEFPVVILPELNRLHSRKSTNFPVDRQLGLTMRPPDGRGGLFAGLGFERSRERIKLRERFEGMRTLYVAATRAEDMLILSGATSDLSKLSEADNSWLAWLWRAVTGGTELLESQEVDLEGARILVEIATVSGPPLQSAVGKVKTEEPRVAEPDGERPVEDYFPLLGKLASESQTSVERFNVTQLAGFKLCPRQYHFRNDLKIKESSTVPATIEPANDDGGFSIAAMLKGSIIHKFCEVFDGTQDIDTCLDSSIDDVIRTRNDDELVVGDEARKNLVKTLRPLVEKYAQSDVFKLLEANRKSLGENESSVDLVGFGVFSEREFVVRREAGRLTGKIDKLIITKMPDGSGTRVEIIDFKTDRLKRNRAEEDSEVDLAQIADLARTYLPQMQSYALAAWLSVPEVNDLKTTLHFLDKDYEYVIDSEELALQTCAETVDNAIEALAVAERNQDFPPRTGSQCFHCNYRKFCAEGREFVSEREITK